MVLSGRYYDKMATIHTYMTLKRFPGGLRHRVHLYFKSYFEQRTALDECAILNDLAPQLRAEVGQCCVLFLRHACPVGGAIVAGGSR